MKIVLTGGPCGGKTTFVGLAIKRLREKVAIVPEAATLVYKGGFPRKNGDFAQECVQRAIYHVQYELETLNAHLHPKASLICDRGSLDGGAYFPGDISSFLASIKSDYKTEAARYDWVLHFQTANEESYDHSNPFRIETYQEAVSLDNRIKDCWSKHPRQILIHSDQDFLKKMEMGVYVLEAILDGLSKEEIVENILI